MVEEKWNWCIIPHYSKPKVVWDIFVMTFAVYNAVEVPFTVSFQPGFADHWGFKIFEHFIDVIFGFDILVNFRTSYVNTKTGDIIFKQKSIAWNYLVTRFTIDFLSTIPFELFALIFVPKEKTTLLSAFGLLKMIRILRLGRLIAYLNL